MSLICPIKEILLNLLNSFLGGKGNKRLVFAIISIVVFTVFGIETFLASKVQAATGVRHVINFQGKVVNSNGTNVADGLYRFQFKIYTVSSGGAAVWTEDWDSGNKIQVTGGIFQAQLGTVTTLPGSIDFNTDNIYLGVTFHTDGEMTPRVQFATVPQAFNAEKVNGLTVTNTSDLPFSSTTILKIASGKTVVVNAGLTFSGTDTTTFTFPSTGGNVVTEDFAQTLTNKTIGSTGLTFSGASTDVTTVSNEDFTFAPNGSGDLILTSDFDSGVSIGSVNSNPAPLSVTGGIGNNAALIVNQLNSGNLFAASAAGVTKFEITSTGAITSQAYTNTGGIVYTTSTGLLSQTAGGTNGNCLTYTGGLPAWGACSGDGLWRSFQGAVSPVNDSFDLLVGSNATTSAKFAIIGVNNARGLQTASISGNLVMDAAGSLQTTLNQTLIIGGDTSGDLLLKSNNVFVLRAPGTANIFVGSNAGVAGLSGTNNVVLGGTAGNALAAGSRNTFIGDGAGQSNNGSDNTFVGRITGNAAGAGTNNAFFGTSTGTNNLGGSYNTFIGYGAGNVNTEGLYNTIVGTSADLVGNSLTNANAFGTQAIVAASNSLVLGGTGLYAVNVGIGTTIPLSALHVNGGNNGGRAAVIFNQTGVSSNDIFAASSSGTTKFVIKNDGTASTSASFVIDGSGALQATRNQTLTLGGGTTGSINISPLNGSGILNLNLASSNGLKINGTSGSTLASSNLCISDVTNGIVVGTTTCESGGSSNWVLSSSFGTLSPINNTLDLLWGGTATQSAKFAVLGIDGTNTPVASVSATTGANANKGIYISGDGSIQSVRNNNLVLGGNTTGNIQFRPLNSTGLVTLIHGDSGTGGLQLQTNETDATTKNARIKMGHFTNLEEPISILVGNNNGIDNNLFFGGGSGTENSATDIHLMTGATNTTLTGTTRMHISRQGNIGIGDSQYNAPSKLFVMGTYGVSPLAIFSETGTNDIFIASSGGTTKFTLKNDGTASTSASFVIDGSGALQATRNQTLTLGGDSTGNIVFKPGNSSASLSLSSNGAIGVNGSYGVSGQCLITSGSSAAPNWAGCSSGSSSNWWTLQSAQGTLYPVNTTLDMLWGGTATESATFRLTGNTAVAGTTSVASISANTSFAAFVIDQRGSGDFFTASSSGLTKFTITKEGGILASSGLTINKLGSLDIVKSTSGNNQVDSDFERTANGTPATLTNLDNSGGEISLSSGTVSGDGTITTGSQPVLPGAAGAGGHSILAQNGKYLVVRGGATTLYVYDSLANSFTTSSQVLNAAAGAGAMSLPRADGRYLVLHGGGATTNSIVDPTGTMAVGASVASGAMNTGTNAFRRQNGRYLILRGGAAATQLWDPSAAATSFVTGPNPTGTIGAGSLVLARQNGTALVVIGGASAVTNVYNPFNGTITSTVPIGSFEVGPSLPTNCEINGAGSVALQKADGRYIILSKAGVSVEYDPATNTMGPCQAVGPAAALADGAHAIRLQDRRFLIFRGSGTTNAYIYDPATNTYSTHATSTSTQGAGAHSLQKADGTWMLVAGGSTTTNKYDSQLVMNGTYTSEDINTSALNPSSTLHYIIGAEANFTGTSSATTDIPQTGVEISVRTAGSQGGLSSANDIPIRRSGELIRSIDGNSWVRVTAQFTRPIPQRLYDERKTYTGNGTTVYMRDYLSPTLYEYTIDNSSVLTRTGWDFVNSQGQQDPTEASASAITRLLPMNDRLVLPWGNVPGQTPVGNTGLYMGKPGPHPTTLQYTGEGTLVIQRPGGMFAIIATGSANMHLYDPASSTFTAQSGAGNIPTDSVGSGSAALKLPDGRFLVVLGNGTRTTNIYDPNAASGSRFVQGPNMSGIVAQGALILPNTDGTYTIMHGGGQIYSTLFNPFTDLTLPPGYNLPGGPTTVLASPINCGAWAIPLKGANEGLYRVFIGRAIGVTGVTTTMNYDARAKIFNAGTALTTAHGCGSMAFQRQDGYWISLTASGGTNGMPQATTNVHNPFYNAAAAAQSTLAGPAMTASVGRGSTVIPRPDGTFLIIHGQQGQAPTSTSTIYVPWGGTYGVGAPIGFTSAGPALNDVAGAGATVFQRQDGKWIILNGGHVGSATVNIYDAGWYPDGQYLSGQMYAPQLTPDSVITWKKGIDNYIGFEVRTAHTREALLTKSYNSISRSGDVIGAEVGDKWVQVQINFSRQFNGFADGTRGDVWFSGGARPFLNFPTPTLFEYKISNDTDLLKLQSNGSNAFRVSEDGSVFVGQQGGFYTGGADLAENYSSRETLVAGEVVQIDATSGNHHVKRSTNQYQSSMLGVVSTEPGFVAGAYTEDSAPIALVGRVPVKISTENGPIHEGDALTSASIPGYAMKATVGGRVLGRALESFNEAQAEQCPTVGMGAVEGTKCGNISVFVNLIDYNGQSVSVAMTEQGYSLDENKLPLIAGLDFAKGTVAHNQQEILGFLQTQKDMGQGIFTDHIAATQDVISPTIITDLLIAKKIRAESIEGLEILTNNIEQLSNRVASGSAVTNFADRLDELKNTQLGMTEQMASLSASLERMKAINLLSFVAKSTESSDLVMVNNFASYGTTTLSQVSVMDTLSVGGNMTIGASSIDTLGEDLELQPLRQGGVNFLGGLIKFNVDGAVTFAENVTFEKDVVIKGVLSATSVSSTELLLGTSDVKLLSDGSVEATGAAGLITFKKNTREIRILNPLVKENSLIFITPKTRTKQPLYLIEQMEADIDNDIQSSFTVGVETDLDADVKFNYLIVN